MYTTGEYLEKNPSWHQADSGWKASKIKEILERNRITFDNIVDVGCGAGGVLRSICDIWPTTLQAHGYDISPDAIGLAKGLDQKSQTIYTCSDFLKEKTDIFDVLLLIDIFEHIEDYLGFLRQLQKRARYFVFHIPLDMHIQGLIRNKQVILREGVGHLHYFSKETALLTLRDSGYEVLDCFYTREALEKPKEELTWKRRLGNIPRRVLFLPFPDLTVKIFGGFSLIVLAKGEET